MKRFIFALLTGLLLSSTLVACNTMEGLGEDIQRGGQSLEREAEEHK
ncbi:MAG: entericidin A/B family lipoprotein [Burkholderiales bacterium]|nr:entericidin A/B family lipoprotein [Burkholderiales bacterium]